MSLNVTYPGKVVAHNLLDSASLSLSDILIAFMSGSDKPTKRLRDRPDPGSTGNADELGGSCAVCPVRNLKSLLGQGFPSELSSTRKRSDLAFSKTLYLWPLILRQAIV